MKQTLSPTIKIVRGLLLSSSFGLLAVFGFWYAGQSLVAVILAGLPLLLLLPGAWLIKRTPLTLCGFLSLVYFAHGLTELIANPARHWFAVVELLLALILLASSSWLLRFRMANA